MGRLRIVTVAIGIVIGLIGSLAAASPLPKNFNHERGRIVLAIYVGDAGETKILDAIAKRASYLSTSTKFHVIRFSSWQALNKRVSIICRGSYLSWLEIVAHGSTLNVGPISVCNLRSFARSLNGRRILRRSTKLLLSGCETGVDMPGLPPNITRLLQKFVRCHVYGSIGDINGCTMTEYLARKDSSLPLHRRVCDIWSSADLTQPLGSIKVSKECLKFGIGRKAFRQLTARSFVFEFCANRPSVDLDREVETSQYSFAFPDVVESKRSVQVSSYERLLLAAILEKTLASPALPEPQVLIAPECSVRYHGKTFDLASGGIILVDSARRLMWRLQADSHSLAAIRKLWVPSAHQNT
jgi:hypothetical protein